MPNIVYVVINQPDGDWDHMATMLGVYSTLEAAQARATGARAQVYAVTVDAVTPYDSLKPMRKGA